MQTAPENLACLMCKHQHFMSLYDFSNDGAIKFKHHQCSDRYCKCKEAIVDNLKYLEVMYERTKTMQDM